MRCRLRGIPLSMGSWPAVLGSGEILLGESGISQWVIYREKQRYQSLSLCFGVLVRDRLGGVCFSLKFDLQHNKKMIWCGALHLLSVWSLSWKWLLWYRYFIHLDNLIKLLILTFLSIIYTVAGDILCCKQGSIRWRHISISFQFHASFYSNL